MPDSKRQGEAFFYPSMARKLLEGYLKHDRSTLPAGPSGYDELSDREREVLFLLVSGLSNQEIAEKLVVNSSTVQTHRGHILQQLGLETTLNLVCSAIRHGLIECPCVWASRRSAAPLRPITQTTTRIAICWRFYPSSHDMPPRRKPLQWQGRRTVPVNHSLSFCEIKHKAILFRQCHIVELFTVRLWLEEFADGSSEWRGKVQHVLSGETRYFREWRGLHAKLEDMLRATRSMREVEP